MAEPSLLSALSPIQWLRLAAAVVVFSGPGVALLWLHPPLRRMPVAAAAVAAALAPAYWAVLVLWLSPMGTPLSPAAAWGVGIAGWAVTGMLWLRHREAEPPTPLPPAPLPTAWAWPALAALVVLAAAVLHVLALGEAVTAPGSDGYHHTLFTQAIMAHGGLPPDLLPLTTLATFTYHFGFHAYAAALGWMAGIDAVVATPLAGQLLKALLALGVAGLAEAAGARRSAPLAAALVVGMLAVFPAWFMNWSRNTQVAGLVILCGLLIVLWTWLRDRCSAAVGPLAALLAAGLALTHYRVAGMAVVAGVVMLFTAAAAARWSSHTWRERILGLAGAVALAVALITPWLWRLSRKPFIGYPVEWGVSDEQVFSLQRLGPGVSGYLTNSLLLALAAAALLWALLRRPLGVWVLLGWFALCYVLSGPLFLGILLDRVTVFTSLFVPLGVLLGWAAGELWAAAARRWPPGRWLWAATVVALSVWGSAPLLHIFDLNERYVLPQDLPAAAWVRRNTPPDSLFMVNTFAFDFNPDYIIGWDAGSWLPVLAGRRAVTAPMIYPVERNVLPDYGQTIAALHHLGGDLTSPAGLELLERAGVTHIFIGKRGGPIRPESLAASERFSLLYDKEGVYVFELARP